MGETKIEWTEHTWNPTRGCSHASPGCANCYAERISARFSGPGDPFELYAERKPKPHFTGKVGLIEDMLDVPLRRRKPTTYFVNSMSDLFHEALPDEAIDRVFAVMALCPQHRFQVLTKRATRMRGWFDGINKRRCGYWCGHGGYLHDVAVKSAMLSEDEAARRIGEAVRLWKPHLPPSPESIGDASVYHVPWPLPNVWLGVSCESQQYADERIPHLLATPAALRFVSAEPLLSGLDLRRYLPIMTDGHYHYADCACLDCYDNRMMTGTRDGRTRFLDWVIVGGESGPGARPFDIAWARSIIAQCKAAGVACFVKQLGAEPWCWGGGKRWPLKLADSKGGDPAEWGAELRVREMPARREQCLCRQF